jgi:hypothetical protein
MKFNKWTLGLAAVGAVSMASAVRADEAKLSSVQTALSNTIISGYVSASANWQLTPGNSQVASSPAGNIPLQGSKANGFNLDVVKLSISKAQDESPWASGYQVDLLFGPDAVGFNPANYGSGSNNGYNSYYDGYSDFAIQQAYIALRTPVGNGIDWKFGVFNTVIGYESFDAGNNPNYTRSWGWAVEPTEHTGLLGSYKINDEWSFSAGVANTLTSGINTRNNYNNSNGSPWHKTVMGSVTFNAPSNWGWASGSAFYAGMVYGFAGNNSSQGEGGSQGGNQANYYVGATLNSPWKDVTFGAAFDYVQNLGGTSYYVDPSVASVHLDDYIFGLYNTIKASDKLSFNSRAEYWEVDAKSNASLGSSAGVSLTETVQYDLWANVVSRLEVRYDKVMTGDYGYHVLPTGVQVTSLDSVGIYANLIYKF